MSWEDQERDELGRWGSGGSAAGPRSEAAGIPSPRKAAQATARMMTVVGHYHPDLEPSYEQRGALKREIAHKTGGDALEVARERGIPEREMLAAAEAYGAASPDGGYNTREALAMMGAEAQMKSLAAGMVNQWAMSSGDHQSTSMATQIAARVEFAIDPDTDDHLASRAEAWYQANQIYSGGGGAMQAVLRAQYENTQSLLKEAGIESVTLYRGTKQSGLYDLSADEVEDAILLQPLSSFTSDPNVALDFAGREGHVVAIQVPADRIFSVPRTGPGAWNEAEVVVLGGPYSAMITSGADIYDSGAGSKHHPGSIDLERRAAASERASEFAALTRALDQELPPSPRALADHAKELFDAYYLPPHKEG